MVTYSVLAQLVVRDRSVRRVKKIETKLELQTIQGFIEIFYMCVYDGTLYCPVPKNWGYSRAHYPDNWRSIEIVPKLTKYFNLPND